MENKMYNVAVRRCNGNVYVDVVHASDNRSAIQAVKMRANPSDKVLGAKEAFYDADVFQYGNFLVKKGKNDLFDIFKCTSHGGKIGKKITDADSMSKAIKKARLLQFGYEECLKCERKSNKTEV